LSNVFLHKPTRKIKIGYLNNRS